MSKIAKALAKAKKQRHKFYPRAQTSDVRASVDALRLDLQQLSYSQTKSIRLNNMHLEINRLHTLIDNALHVIAAKVVSIGIHVTLESPLLHFTHIFVQIFRERGFS